MTVRFIGSKARIAKQIAAIAGVPAPEGGRFIDAFAGTGVVARAAADGGWPVHVNDHLRSAVVLSSALLIGEPDVPFESLGGYDQAIHLLNNMDGERGFIYREYSPASAQTTARERRYFTETNASKIDAIRQQIARWSESQIVSDAEETLLLADLILAANKVANIAGTYSCFLSYWSEQSLRPITLSPRILPRRIQDWSSSELDVFSVETSPDDIVYFDPPYTKRQYAAYYHIPETIAIGDAPEVGGVTGLRPWENKSSPFCYKTKALKSLVRLLSQCPAHRILLSYSDEGHVKLLDLQREISQLGHLRIHALGPVGRYRPNEKAAQARAEVHEYVLEVVRGAPNAWESRGASRPGRS